VICAALPGEAHDMGVYICAVAVAAAGSRPIVLPGQTPPDAIAEAARYIHATHVVISLSVVSVAPHFLESIAALHHHLPGSTRLIVGGGGAPDAFAGATILGSLRDLIAQIERSTDP
jgi:methanogenic corrinoid protein MtbC1